VGGRLASERRLPSPSPSRAVPGRVPSSPSGAPAAIAAAVASSAELGRRRRHFPHAGGPSAPPPPARLPAPLGRLSSVHEPGHLIASIAAQARGFEAMGRHADEGAQLQLVQADRTEEDEESFKSINKCTSRRLFSPSPPPSRLVSPATCLRNKN
jgi:hypothetical protein